jgi:hypothetical protein
VKRGYVMLSATVEKDLADQLRRLAKKNERSVSAEVRIALRSHVNGGGEERP